MRLRLRSSSFLATTVLCGSAAASDWPQFRGLHRDGVARGESVAEQWPDSGPRQCWRRPLGSGFSSVAVVGDRLYTMGAEAETEDVLCLDAATGETLWRTAMGPRFEEQFGDGPRTTPTVTDDAVYAATSQMQFAALSRESGEILWQLDLGEAFGAEASMFGYSSSPLVDGDRVIVEVGAENASVVAFDRHDGKVLWTALSGPANATSPIVVELDGQRQYVFSRRTGPQTVGLSPEGAELWSHPAAEDVIALPHFVPPDQFFTSSAQRGDGGVLFAVQRVDGSFTTRTQWVNRRMRVHFNDAVLVGEHLYGFDNSTLRCVNVSDGEIRWSERGFGKGSLLASEDRLFVLGDEGALALVEATPDEYREHGRVAALQGRCWTSPSLAAGRLYVRNLEELVAYDVQGVDTEPALALLETSSAPTIARSLEAPKTAEELVERYAHARGGLESWNALRTLELRGTFSAFSESAAFTWRKQRGNLYRFDHCMIGAKDSRGRDESGAWWCYHLLEVETPARVEVAEYATQLARESWFEPPLLRAGQNGVSIEWVGPGELEGRPTLDVRLTYTDGSVETWMLDPSTCLEIAVDAKVVDFTQSNQVLDQRTFFSDFRPVQGLVLPFRWSAEFGARLEVTVVHEIDVDPRFPADTFSMPSTNDSELPAGDDGQF